MFRNVSMQIGKGDFTAFKNEKTVRPFEILNNQHCDCVLTMETLSIHNSVQANKGDLFIGLYNNSYAEIAVSIHIGEQQVSSYSIAPNSFAYAINNESVVPLICLAYHQVDVKCENSRHILVLHGYMSTDLRRILCQGGCYAKCGSKFIKYYSGMGGLCDNPGIGKTLLFELSNMRNPH